MALAATMNAPSNFVFAHSETRTVGVLSSLRNLVPEKIRELCQKERQMESDNAPRIVGGMKLLGDVTFGVGDVLFGAAVNPLLLSYSVFAVTGRLIMLTWGSKEHQKKLAEEKAEGKHQNLLGNSWRENDRKILHPRLYPVEAAAGVQTVAEAIGILYGLSLFMASQPWLTPVIIGAIAVYSYGQIVFKKEKKTHEVAEGEKEASGTLAFAQSESKSAGYQSARLRQAMKGNPVLISSLINIGICVFGFVGGLLEKNAPYIRAMPIFIAANILQALMVKKNDYNIEGANLEKTGIPSSATFQERVAAAKSRDNDLGMQPA